MPHKRAIRWYLAGVFTSAAIAALALAWDRAPRDEGRSAPAPHVLTRTEARPGPRFEAAVGESTKGRVPGEFEHQEALVLGFNELVEYHPRTLVDIVAAISDRICIIGLISKPEQQRKVLDLLDEHKVKASNIEFFLWPAISMWVQDFGPTFLVDDTVRIIDCGYVHANRDAENLMPTAFAARFGFAVKPCELTFDGGNMQSNGQGFCVTTTDVLAQNKSRGYDAHQIGDIFHREFRFKKWTYLQMLDGEPLGHVDMFMTFITPTKIVLGKLDSADDWKNAQLLDEHAATLGAVTTDEGKIEVERIPMPSHRDGKWRTYTNVIFANGVLLVPQYPDFSPELDAEALAVYRKLMPDWKVVGINSSSLINNRGSLHCVSVNVPVFPQHDTAAE